MSVTVYTDILSTEMFLEILDYFRPMCSTDIFIYFDGWYTVHEEISKKNEQEARKREIRYFWDAESMRKSEEKYFRLFFFLIT